MGTLVDWQHAGVTFKVEVQTNKQLILAAKTYDLTPLQPGGPSGIPLGWTGQGVYSSANITNGVFAGIYTMQNTSTTIVSSLAGAEYTVGPIQAAKKYLVVVDSRGLAGKLNFRRTFRVSEYNPTTGAQNTLQQFSDAGGSPAPAEWQTTGLTVDGSAFNIAGGFTHMRVGLLGTRDVDALPFGIQWANPYIQERDPVLPTITWRDITCDVRAITVRYGRERFTERFDVATLQMQLLNKDGEYSYAEPHPFNFGPGRIVKITGTYLGVTYAFAYHIIDQCIDAMTVDGEAVTNVSCLDPTSLMSTRPTPNIPGATTTAGPRIGLVLDFAGYPLRSLETGVLPLQRITSSGRVLRDEMGISSDSDGGYLFANRGGAIQFMQRNWENATLDNTQVSANLWAKPSNTDAPVDGWPTQPTAPTICLSALSTDWGMSRVVNFLQLANAGGSVRTYEDEQSQREHGIRGYQRTDFVLASDSNLDVRAADILTGNSVPKLRLNSVTFKPGLDGNDFVYAFRVSFLYLVRTWYQNIKTGWGWSMVSHVQGFEHHVTPTEWTTTLTLDMPRTFATAPSTVQAHWDGTATSDRWDVAVWS